MLPRYDKNRKLTSVLKCDEMTLVSDDVITGKRVSIESFHPDRTVKARINLASAIYDQAQSLLRAGEAVVISSERLHAVGTGLVYSLDQQKGFLNGPVTTTLLQARPTAMNPASPSLRATALLGISLMPLIAAPPKATPEETAQIERDAAPMAEKAAAAEKTARNELRAALEASDATNKSAIEFLEKADLLAANGSASAEPAPEPEPLAVPNDPTLTKVDSKGLYFDSTENVVVFLKDIVVNDPGYHLTAANELKIYFDKKEPAAPKAPAPDEDSKAGDKRGSIRFGGGNFGDPRLIVATGAVKVVQKNPAQGEEAVQASGAMFHYDIATETITIRGGSPWFIRGNQGLRAGKPDSWLRLDKNYNITTDPNGQWTLFGNLKGAQKR